MWDRPEPPYGRQTHDPRGPVQAASGATATGDICGAGRGDRAGRTASGRRVLVVDDDRDAADSLAVVLGVLGYRVDVAYGGAGPLHATQVARELGIRRVIVPTAPGVFSAFGMLFSDLRYDFVRTQLMRLDDAPFNPRSPARSAPPMLRADDRARVAAGSNARRRQRRFSGRAGGRPPPASPSPRPSPCRRSSTAGGRRTRR